jgi:hypothetical protein
LTEKKKITRLMGKKFGTYTSEAVEAALYAIRNENCPVRIAADTHGIPRETLRRRLKGLPTRAESKRDMLKVPPHLERRLLAWLRAQSVLGTQISHATFTAIVLALLKRELGTENVYIGQTWFGRFLKRHGCAGLVSFRAFRSDIVRDKFGERENVIWTMELLRKLGFRSTLSQGKRQPQEKQDGIEHQGQSSEGFPPLENVWCLTEIAFCGTDEVLLGGDECRERSASVGGVWLRALECMSANGAVLNPTLVRSKLPQHQQPSDSGGSGDRSSHSIDATTNWKQDTDTPQRLGWWYTTDDLHNPALSQQTALDWMTHVFLPVVCAEPPINNSSDSKDNNSLKLLFVHGIHDAFFSAPIQQLCGFHNLHIVYLPAHTSERFQLCDLFAALRVAFTSSTTTRVDNMFMDSMNTAAAAVAAAGLVETVRPAMEERALHVYAQFRSAVLLQNPNTVRDAWCKSGIAPFNPAAVLFPNELVSFETLAMVGGGSSPGARDVAIADPGAADHQPQLVQQISLPQLPDYDNVNGGQPAEQPITIPKTANELYTLMSAIQTDASLSDALKRRRVMYTYKKLYAKMDMLEQKATALEKENELLKLSAQRSRPSIP